MIWRRSYTTPPPALELDDRASPTVTIRVTPLCPPTRLPGAESLANTVERFLPLWHETIAPQIRNGSAC